MWSATDAEPALYGERAVRPFAAPPGDRKPAPPAATNRDEGTRREAGCSLAGESDEGELVDAARAGSAEAFGRLAASARPRLVRHLLVTGGDCDEAEEVAQEALARAWESIGSFEGRSGFYTWLYSIASFTRLDRRRRIGRRPDLGGPRRVEATDALEERRAEGALDRLIAEERREVLRAEIEALPERQRLALLLRFVEGLSCSEIGEQLGTTANGASMLIFRAKADLMARLSGGGPGGGGHDLR